MAISIIGAASNSSGATSSNTGSVVMPSSIVAGDVAYFICASNVSGNIWVAPSGAVAVTGSPLVPGSSMGASAFRKTLAGTESGTTVTAGAGGSSKWAMGVVVLRGAGAENATVTAADNSSDTTILYPGLTPTATNSLLVAIGGIQVPVGPATHAAPAGWTERTENYTTTTDPQIGIFISTKQLVGQNGVAQADASASATVVVRDAIFMLSITDAGVANVAPTANAGPDQIGIYPYDVVTVSGSGSTDPDGTIVAHTWTPPPGITLSGTGTGPRTFEAPATPTGGVYTLSLTVTDNLGAVSTADAMTVTVAPHVRFYIAAGGARLPIWRRRVT